MAKKPLPGQMKEFLEEHLPYEITLMREAYKLALVASPWPQHNCHIVAFLNASRNLIEFFKNKPSCDFDPRMFTRSTYELEKRFLRDSLLPQINNQISHLTSKRTQVLADKIGEKLWSEIHGDLEAEISRFDKALTDEYRKIWPLKPCFAVNALHTASQSSSPQFVSGPTGPGPRTDQEVSGPTGPSGPTR